MDIDNAYTGRLHPITDPRKQLTLTFNHKVTKYCCLAGVVLLTVVCVALLMSATVKIHEIEEQAEQNKKGLLQKLHKIHHKLGKDEHKLQKLSKAEHMEIGNTTCDNTEDKSGWISTAIQFSKTYKHPPHVVTSVNSYTNNLDETVVGFRVKPSNVTVSGFIITCQIEWARHHGPYISHNLGVNWIAYPEDRFRHHNKTSHHHHHHHHKTSHHHHHHKKTA